MLLMDSCGMPARLFWKLFDNVPVVSPRYLTRAFPHYCLKPPFLHSSSLSSVTCILHGPRECTIHCFVRRQ